jgi:hypothetical protein
MYTTDGGDQRPTPSHALKLLLTSLPRQLRYQAGPAVDFTTIYGLSQPFL